MLNVLLWYVLVNRLSQVNISMQSYLGEISCICRVMHGNELQNQIPIHVVNGVYLWNVLRKISNVFLFFFFQMCLWTWKNDLRTWKYKLLGIYTQDCHPHKQTAKPQPKNEPPLLCINSSVESFNEEFFTKSKLHDHFVDFIFFQKGVLKLQNQI